MIGIIDRKIVKSHTIRSMGYDVLTKLIFILAVCYEEN
jgi:hypothetical protein